MTKRLEPFRTRLGERRKAGRAEGLGVGRAQRRAAATQQEEIKATGNMVSTIISRAVV